MEQFISFEDCYEHSVATNFFNLAYEGAMDNIRDLHYITEKSHVTLIEKIKQVVASIIAGFKSMVAEIKIQLEEKARNKEFRDKTAHNIEKFQQMKLQGVHSVRIVNMKNYRNIYIKMNNELHRYITKFDKIKYTQTWQIEDDFNKFDKIVNDYQYKIEEAIHQTIEIPIDKAIQLYSDQLRGKNTWVDDLNREMTKFRQYEESGKHIRTLYGIQGQNVIPIHQNFFVRMINAAAKAIKKAIVKAITVVVFIF